MLFTTLGYPWYYAPLSGLIVYAGAAQFLSIGLLAARAGLSEIFVATLLLNLRHVFYGFSLLNRFPDDFPRRAYSIFGLTDETYSVLTSTKQSDRREDQSFCFYLTLLNHIYWTASCALGALAGSGFGLRLRGLDFALTALFVVLAIEQAKTVRRWLPFALAALAAAAALTVNRERFLLIATSSVFVALTLAPVSKAPRHG